MIGGQTPSTQKESSNDIDCISGYMAVAASAGPTARAFSAGTEHAVKFPLPGEPLLVSLAKQFRTCNRMAGVDLMCSTGMPAATISCATCTTPAAIAVSLEIRPRSPTEVHLNRTPSQDLDFGFQDVHGGGSKHTVTRVIVTIRDSSDPIHPNTICLTLKPPSSLSSSRVPPPVWE